MTRPNLTRPLAMYLATCPSCRDNHQVREKHPTYQWNPPCDICFTRYTPNQLEERVRAYAQENATAPPETE
jgi:hypothetical protein